MGLSVHRRPGHPDLNEGSFSQAVPLMDDESIGRFASTMSIAAFESAVVATENEMKNEHNIKLVQFSSGHWFPQSFVILDPTHYIVITLMGVLICDYMITVG